MKQHRIHKKWFLSCMVVLAMFMVSACSESSEKEETEAGSASPAPVVEEETKAKQELQIGPQPETTEESITKLPPQSNTSLGMDLETFIDEYNKLADGFGLAVNKELVELQGRGVQLSFKYVYSDILVLGGIINKDDNTLRYIILTGQLDGTYPSFSNIYHSIAAIIQTTNPQLSAEDRIKMMEKLGFTEQLTDINKLNGETVLNGIRYSVSGSDIIGITLYVANENEKNNK